MWYKSDITADWLAKQNLELEPESALPVFLNSITKYYIYFTDETGRLRRLQKNHNIKVDDPYSIVKIYSKEHLSKLHLEITGKELN